MKKAEVTITSHRGTIETRKTSHRGTGAQGKTHSYQIAHPLYFLAFKIIYHRDSQEENDKFSNLLFPSVPPCLRERVFMFIMGDVRYG